MHTPVRQRVAVCRARKKKRGSLPIEAELLAHERAGSFNALSCLLGRTVDVLPSLVLPAVRGKDRLHRAGLRPCTAQRIRHAPAPGWMVLTGLMCASPTGHSDWGQHPTRFRRRRPCTAQRIRDAYWQPAPEWRNAVTDMHTPVRQRVAVCRARKKKRGSLPIEAELLAHERAELVRHGQAPAAASSASASEALSSSSSSCSRNSDRKSSVSP